VTVTEGRLPWTLAGTFRHLLLPAPAILVARVLWDVAPVRIRLPARERAPQQRSWITRLLCSSGAVRDEAPRSWGIRSHRWARMPPARRARENPQGRMTVITGSLSPPPRSVGATAPMTIGGLGEAHLTVLKRAKGQVVRGTL